MDARVANTGSDLRVALVHDWLLGMRGGERCLETLCDLFPNARVYTLFYEPAEISATIRDRQPRVSALGLLPGVRRYYRHLFPLYPLGVRSLSAQLARDHAQEPFDLVISVSHCAVKNIRVPAGVRHLCYCLTPARYLFDQYAAYFARSRLEPVIRRVVERLRRWDQAGSAGVDHFVAISSFIAERIKKAYGRSSSIIYPPVDTSWIAPCRSIERTSEFLSVSALVPYKNVELVVRVFTQLGLPLTVVGRGPEASRLRSAAGPNITFLGHVSEQRLAELYARSAALVFAAEEDFGMTPVEMQAAGGPVIALGRGGSLETVRGGSEEPTGVFFSDPNEESLRVAVEYFLDRRHDFTVDNCVKHAQRFSKEIFCERFRSELGALGCLEVESPPTPAALRNVSC